jgi:hypothetical protein
MIAWKSMSKPLTLSLATWAMTAGLAALAGCGAEAADQDQPLGSEKGRDPGKDPGDSGTAPGDCKGILDGTCVTKDAAGNIKPCAGAELEAFKKQQQAAFEACQLEVTCRTTIFDPAVAKCPAKSDPTFMTCYNAAYDAYIKCQGINPNPGGSNPGTGK